MMTAPIRALLGGFTPPSKDEILNHLRSLAPSNLYGDEDDPKKKGKGKTYQSQAQIDADNAFAQDFNKRHNLQNGVGIIAGTNIGDPVVPFRTLDGKPYTPNQMPASMINNTVPDWVDQLHWDNDWQMPYYLDGNDMKFVKKEFYNSPRFIKPNPPQNLIAKK